MAAIRRTARTNGKGKGTAMAGLTRSKFTITIDIQDVMDRNPDNKDVRREILTAIRQWCDRAEQFGLGGNIVADGRIIGKAHATRPRHKR